MGSWAKPLKIKKSWLFDQENLKIVVFWMIQNLNHGKKPHFKKCGFNLWT